MDCGGGKVSDIVGVVEEVRCRRGGTVGSSSWRRYRGGVLDEVRCRRGGKVLSRR